MKETYQQPADIQDAPSVESTPTKPAPTVEDVIDQINIDCRVNPNEYVEEVDIPGGGE